MSESCYIPQSVKSTSRDSIIISGVRHAVPLEVTFRDFTALARRKGWTAEFLAEQFRGKIAEPSEIFHRVLSCEYKGENRGGVVIPYHSVLDFYQRELSPLIAEGNVRLCICKCGRRVHGRKQYATPYCRVKTHRQEAQIPKKGSEKAA